MAIMIHPIVEYELTATRDITRPSIQYDPESQFIITNPINYDNKDEGVAVLIVADILSLSIGVESGVIYEYDGYIGPKQGWNKQTLKDIHPVPASVKILVTSERLENGTGYSTPLSDVYEEYDTDKQLLRFGTGEDDDKQLLCFNNLVIGVRNNYLNSIYVRGIQ